MPSRPRLFRRLGLPALLCAASIVLAGPTAAAAPRWSTTATAAPATAHVASRSLSLAVDGQGNSDFVWSPGGIYARVRGVGGGFGPITTVTSDRFGGVEEAPFGIVVADPFGGATIVWAPVDDIHAAQRAPGRLFGGDEVVGRSYELFAQGPAITPDPGTIAVDGAGNVRLLVLGPPPRGAYPGVYLTEHSPGQAFSSPRLLGAPPRLGSPAIGPRGDVAVLSFGADPGTRPATGKTAPTYVSVRSADGLTLGPPEPTGIAVLAGPSAYGYAFQLAVSPEGAVALMVASSNDGVRVAVRPPGGHFGAPQLLDRNGAGVDGRRIALRYGTKGDLIAVWGIPGAGNSGSVRGALAGPSGRFGPAHTLATNAYIDKANRGSPEPRIAIAKDGSALIGWTKRTRPRLALWTCLRRHGHSFERPASVMSIYPNAYAIAGGGGRFVAAAVSPFDRSVRTRTLPVG